MEDMYNIGYTFSRYLDKRSIAHKKYLFLFLNYVIYSIIYPIALFTGSTPARVAVFNISNDLYICIDGAGIMFGGTPDTMLYFNETGYFLNCLK